MRVVQVLLDDRIGGAERLAATLAAEWERRGDQVDVVFLDPVAGVDTSPFARVLRLRSALRAVEADLIVAHSALPNLYTRVAAPLGTPVVSVLHSAQDDFDQRSLRLAERVVHRRGIVVAVSEAQREVYRKRFPGARTLTIPNGIAAGLPRREPRTRRSDEPVRVVTVSRVADQKRPELWQQIARAAVELPLAFEWHGPAMEAAAAGLVEAHRVAGAPGRFMGATDRVGEVLASSDVLLHTASAEASSIGLMEAAAVGVPIICGRAVERTLPPGLAWASYDDADGALDALERLLGDPAAADEHAMRWREDVRDVASAARCAAAYRALATGVAQP